MNWPKQKYRTIYADPPWPEYGGGRIRRGANRHYALMSVAEIKHLPVWELAEENCHLYLWVTNSKLPMGLSVMEAWGFNYRSVITWAKDRFGLGQYYRGQTEHCLFGVKGNLPYRTLDGKRAQGTTLIQAKRTQHSSKPVQMREMIEKVSWPPYIELFARPRVDLFSADDQWDYWGAEVPEEFGVRKCIEDWPFKEQNPEAYEALADELTTEHIWEWRSGV